MSKYHAKKIDTPDGVFDSKGEYKRWLVLKEMERIGKIRDLQRQVEYVLAEAAREPDIIGPRGGHKPGKTILREVKYKADFVYEENGETVVEDFKGFRTEAYKIKRAWMYQRYNILIRET